MYTLAEAVMRCGVALPVVLLFLLLFGAPSSARAEERHFGAKAGPNFAVLSLDADYEGESYDRRIAVGGGGFVVLPVNQRLAVQLEALYNPKGAKLFDEELG